MSDTTPMQGMAEYLRQIAHQQSAPDTLRAWADDVDAAASAGQAIGLYAAREADIKAYLDEVAPGTTGNILERVRQLTASQAIQWPIMPPNKGQSPVLFEDGYAEGWAKCLSQCQQALAASVPIQAVPMPELPEGAILESDTLVRRVKFAYPFERQAEVLKAFGSWAWPLNGPSNPDGSWQRLIAEKVVGTAQPASEPIPAAPAQAEQIESLRQWFIRNHKFWLTRDSIRAALEDAGIGGAPSVVPSKGEGQ